MSTQKTAILVIGMHRSGTSMLARAVSLLGADLPDDLLTPSIEDNANGYWESRSIVRAHERFFHSIGWRWDNPFPIPRAALHEKAACALKEELRLLLSYEFEKKNVLVIKDPRMCRVLPLWYDLLKSMEVDAKSILIVRAPFEVATSLHKRRGMKQELATALWLAHSLEAEKETRGYDRCIMPYHKLKTSPEQSLNPLIEMLSDICKPSPSMIREVVASININQPAPSTETHKDKDIAGCQSQAGSPVVEPLTNLAGKTCKALQDANSNADKLTILAEAFQKKLYDGKEEYENILKLNPVGDGVKYLPVTVLSGQKKFEQFNNQDMPKHSMPKYSGGWRFKARLLLETLSLMTILKQGLLDAAWYKKEHNLKVLPALWHYILVGCFRQFSPSPLFDIKFYILSNPDLHGAIANPLRHFVAYGARERRNPHPMFDVEYYVECQPGLLKTKENPLLHYLRFGWRKGYRPNPFFDSARYAQASDCSEAPLSHFIKHRS